MWRFYIRSQTESESVCICQTHIIMNTLIYDVVNTQFYCDIVLFECFHNFSFALKSCLVIDIGECVKFGISSFKQIHKNTYAHTGAPHALIRIPIHITSLPLSLSLFICIKTLDPFDRTAKNVHIFFLTASEFTHFFPLWYHILQGEHIFVYIRFYYLCMC